MTAILEQVFVRIAGLFKRKFSVLESLEEEGNIPASKVARYSQSIDARSGSFDRYCSTTPKQEEPPERSRLFSPSVLVTPTVAEWFDPVAKRSQARLFSIPSRRPVRSDGRVTNKSATNFKNLVSNGTRSGPFNNPSGLDSSYVSSRYRTAQSTPPVVNLTNVEDDVDVSVLPSCSQSFRGRSRLSVSSLPINRTCPMSNLNDTLPPGSPLRTPAKAEQTSSSQHQSQAVSDSYSPTSKLHLMLRQRRWDRDRKPDTVNLTAKYREKKSKYHQNSSMSTWDNLTRHKSWLAGGRACTSVTKSHRRSHNDFQSSLQETVRLEERTVYKMVLAKYFAEQSAVDALPSDDCNAAANNSTIIDVVDITQDAEGEDVVFDYEAGGKEARHLVGELYDIYGGAVDETTLGLSPDSRSPTLSPSPGGSSKHANGQRSSLPKEVVSDSASSNESPEIVDLDEDSVTVPVTNSDKPKIISFVSGASARPSTSGSVNPPGQSVHRCRYKPADVRSLNEKFHSFNLERDRIVHSLSDFTNDAKQRKHNAESLEAESKVLEDERFRCMARSENEARRRLRIAGYIVPEPDVSVEEEVVEYDEFPELTDEQTEFIRRIWSRGGNPDQVVVEAFKIPVTKHDLGTLQGSVWLNDEVINFYMNLIAERSKDKENQLHPSGSLPSVHVFSTFFYPKLSKTGHSGVRRWTKSIDVFGEDLILVPIHLGMHWCMATIDFRSKEIKYFDSLGKTNQPCLDRLREYLVDEYKDKKKDVLDVGDWSLLTPSDIPMQMNGSDCGVFACKFAEYASRDAAHTFGQEHMNYFRQRMVWEICHKQLL